MSRNAKIILGIIIALLVICICVAGIGFFVLRSAGGALEQAIAIAPDQVADVSAEIVDYEVPAGYEEQFGFSLLGFDIVALGPTDGSEQLIMLMQVPAAAGMDQAQMEQQLQQALEQQLGRQQLQLDEVEQRTTTIRDQTVELIVREGTDPDGSAFRQISGVFEGQDGPVLLMILGPTQSWDQAAVDTFIESIR